MTGTRGRPAAVRRGRWPGALPARRTRTVGLLGVDGAGKTTTAAALVAAEEEAGREAVVLRNRSGRR